jgi:signal transduction histidine kinase
MSLTDFGATGEAFGDAMDHALGEPLARARAGSRVLADQVGETHAVAVQSIVDALERSESVLRDFVEFVRSGEMQVVRRRADLRPLCERVIDSMERRYRPVRALELDSDARVVGDWDTDAVAGLVARLLGTALEHAGDGAVGVRLRGLEDRALIDVWTTWALPSGGERFAVGLHLASLAARAHHGRVDVTSTAREGTTFRVTLPRYAASGPLFMIFDQVRGPYL